MNIHLLYQLLYHVLWIQTKFNEKIRNNFNLQAETAQVRDHL